MMLARGSKGVDVMELQLNLMKLGFNPGSKLKENYLKNGNKPPFLSTVMKGLVNVANDFRYFVEIFKERTMCLSWFSLFFHRSL